MPKIVAKPRKPRKPKAVIIDHEAPLDPVALTELLRLADAKLAHQVKAFNRCSILQAARIAETKTTIESLQNRSSSYLQAANLNYRFGIENAVAPPPANFTSIGSVVFDNVIQFGPVENLDSAVEYGGKVFIGKSRVCMDASELTPSTTDPFLGETLELYDLDMRRMVAASLKLPNTLTICDDKWAAYTRRTKCKVYQFMGPNTDPSLNPFHETHEIWSIQEGANAYLEMQQNTFSSFEPKSPLPNPTLETATFKVRADRIGYTRDADEIVL